MKQQAHDEVRTPQAYRKKNKAICWFKHTASEHLARVRELVAILRSLIRNAETPRRGEL